MRTDRELLELAAKAAIRAGLKLECPDDPNGAYVDRVERRVWNPFANDGAALRLAVVLRISIEISGNEDEFFEVCCNQSWESFIHDYDSMPATRLAIVRAAAEIGAAM